jgi:hypothetical protein
MAEIKMTTAVKGTCIICNCMPVDETKETRPPLPMFHAVGVDVNWGEDCNICKICAGVMADMMGRPDELKVAKLSRQFRALKESYDEQTERFDKYREKVRELVAGTKAKKELKEMES